MDDRKLTDADRVRLHAERDTWIDQAIFLLNGDRHWSAALDCLRRAEEITQQVAASLERDSGQGQRCPDRLGRLADHVRAILGGRQPLAAIGLEVGLDLLGGHGVGRKRFSADGSIQRLAQDLANAVRHARRPIEPAPLCLEPREHLRNEPAIHDGAGDGLAIFD